MRGPRLQFRFNNQKELNCIIALLNLLGFHNRRTNPLLMFQGNIFQEGLSIFCNYSDEHPFGYIGIASNYDQNYYLTLDDSGINNADSSYDLLDNKWIKKPIKSNYKVPYNYGLEIAKFFMYGIDNKIAELDRDLQELKIYIWF